MRFKLTPTQSEIIHLMYTNINNANTYCETLLQDDELFKGIKEETFRPMHVKIKFLKQALELKMPRELYKLRETLFDDTMAYDEVARMMAYMSPEKRNAVEEFAKSIL